MNKLVIFVFLLSALYSCKKDEPNYKNENHIDISSLPGKWYQVRDTVIDYVNGKVTNIETQPNPGTIIPNYYVQFNTNATGVVSNGFGPINFTYSVTGNQISIQTLILSQAAEVSTIKTLTSNSLVIFYEDVYTQGSDTNRETEIIYFVKR